MHSNGRISEGQGLLLKGEGERDSVCVRGLGGGRRSGRDQDIK